MRKILYSFIGLSFLGTAFAQIPTCDSTNKTVATLGLKMELGGIYSTCDQEQFTLNVQGSNIAWFKETTNRGGGNTLFSNEPGTYTAISLLPANKCVIYGPFVISKGSKPSAEIDYITRFFCKDSLGTTLHAKTNALNATFQWFKNGGLEAGKTSSSLVANTNSSWSVEVNDRGCKTQSQQVQTQEKDCGNIVCPEIKLNYNGLVEIRPNVYRFCDSVSNLSLTSTKGSLSDINFYWYKNGELKSKNSNYKVNSPGLYKVLVNDFLVCKDSISFVIESGKIADVSIQDKKEGKIIYCLNNPDKAILQATTNATVDVDFKWYVKVNAQYKFVSVGSKLENVIAGKYKVVLSNKDCDMIAMDSVQVDSFDCAKNCFGLNIYSNELKKVSDSSYTTCRNIFQVQVQNTLGNTNGAIFTWYKNGLEIAKGNSLQINKPVAEAAGKYTIRVEKTGECIEELTFYIVNQTIAKISIKGKPEVKFCSTVSKNIEAVVEEIEAGIISNYYATWYKKTNNTWQNVGGGLVLYNISEGVYKVELNGDACVGISSDSVTTKLVEDCTVLSIVSQGEYSSMIIPNPASENIRVSSFSSLKKVSIYTLTGNLVLEATTPDITVTSLLNGCYIVKIESINGTEVHRFIKK